MAPNHETNGYHPVSRLTSVQRLDSRVMHIGAKSGTHRALPPVKRRGWHRAAGYVVAGAIAAGALVAGARPWFVADAADALPHAVAHDAARHVSVALPERQQVGTVSLPATVEPFQSARLYARVAGYVKSWNAELGAAVKAGDVLAVIDTPDLDQQLLQARSDLNVASAAVSQAEAELAESQATLESTKAELKRAEADLALANSRLKRRQSLFDKNAATQDDLDTAIRDRDAREADITASQAAVTRQAANLNTQAAIIASRQASVESQRANVKRLEELQGFQHIVAPFDGVVTQRNAEVGQLVSAGGNASQDELYVVAQTDRVRVQTPVPQSEALGIRNGSAVTVRIPELPGQDIAAAVTRTSQSVDPNARTLLTEVELSNSDGKLYPGVYAEVVIQTQMPQTTWVVPANTLRMQTDGPHVVVAGEFGALEVRPVELGRDFGRTVAVVKGLHGGERLVVNPTDDLSAGMPVSVTTPVETARIAAQ
jgi:RND family efflux transporter MFP subunit